MTERTVPGTTATAVVAAQGETVVHYRAVNSSGQEADKAVTVKVDTVAPTVAVRAPLEGGRYVTGSSVTVQADCADAGSGLASCTPNGVALDTAGTGARTVTATATDAAGNTSSKTVNYTVTPAPVVNAELVYVRSNDGSPGPIQRSNADGTNVVQIADRGDDPVWSPDGTKVAYTTSSGNGRQVFVVNADGTGTVAVTSLTTWQASVPAWSPDGSRIAFQGSWYEPLTPTTGTLHRGILTVPSTGGVSTVVVSSDQTDLRDPTYARNGATITYVAGNSIYSVPVAGVPAEQFGTLLIAAPGSGQRPYHPTWSVDGTTLLFQLGEPETFAGDVYVWKGAGDPVNITSSVAVWPPADGLVLPYEDGPTWLPDGRVIFTQDGDVYLVAPQHGAPKVLLADLAWKVRNVDAAGA
jgi:Tol biopolymer transport system component